MFDHLLVWRSTLQVAPNDRLCEAQGNRYDAAREYVESCKGRLLYLLRSSRDSKNRTKCMCDHILHYGPLQADGSLDTHCMSVGSHDYHLNLAFID